MATFTKTEVLDARQFTGGAQNGTDLTYWVMHVGGDNVVALWHETKPHECIRILYPGHKARTAFIGDWIMQHQDGRFEVVRQQELENDYKIV